MHKQIRPNGCPKCQRSLHYSIEFEEQLCLECNWVQGEPGCDEGYMPERMLKFPDWHTIVGILYSQLKVRQITYIDFNSILDQMGIL